MNDDNRCPKCNSHDLGPCADGSVSCNHCEHNFYLSVPPWLQSKRILINHQLVDRGDERTMITNALHSAIRFLIDESNDEDAEPYFGTALLTGLSLACHLVDIGIDTKVIKISEAILAEAFDYNTFDVQVDLFGED